MALKINDQFIPDWAVERQAQSFFEQVAKSMPGKPREVIQLAAMDLAKDRMMIRHGWHRKVKSVTIWILKKLS